MNTQESIQELIYSNPAMSDADIAAAHNGKDREEADYTYDQVRKALEKLPDVDPIGIGNRLLADLEYVAGTQPAVRVQADMFTSGTGTLDLLSPTIQTFIGTLVQDGTSKLTPEDAQALLLLTKQEQVTAATVAQIRASVADGVIQSQTWLKQLQQVGQQSDLTDLEQVKADIRAFVGPEPDSST